MKNSAAANRLLPTASIWGGAVLGIGVLAMLIGGSGRADGQGAVQPVATQPTQAGPRVGVQAPAARGAVRHGVTQVPPRVPGAVRIATYNVENLFDTTAPANKEEPSSTPTEPKPEAHRKAVAAAIRAVDADIIALEEVESKEVVTRFRDAYLKGMGYDFIASIDSGDPRGIEQSVLSRYPLSNETVWLQLDLGGPHPAQLGNRTNPDAGKPMVLKRSPLGVSVAVPPLSKADGAPGDKGVRGGTGGKPIELGLLALHQKSGAFYGYLREAEAKAVVGLAGAWVQGHPGANVVILGDFNARASEAAFKTYLNAGYTDAFGDVASSHRVENGGKAGGGGGGAGSEDPKYITHASGRAIDHILLAPAAAGNFEIKNQFVFGTPQRPADVDWRTTPPPEGYASDHYPVVVDLLPKAR